MMLLDREIFGTNAEAVVTGAQGQANPTKKLSALERIKAQRLAAEQANATANGADE